MQISFPQILSIMHPSSVRHPHFKLRGVASQTERNVQLADALLDRNGEGCGAFGRRDGELTGDANSCELTGGAARAK
jgi:hypothetical protein